MRNNVCIAVFAAALLLGGCDITTPSQVKTGQVRITEQMQTVVLNARHVDGAAVNSIADDYDRNGRGQVMMVVTYLQGNPLNELEAKKQAGAYKAALAKRDVNDVKIDYVGVTDKSQNGQAIVSYLAMTALPPSNCGPITGYQGADQLTDVHDYAFGCETKTALSKMISRPDDLRGRAGTPDDDAKRQGAMVEKYRTGTPNEPMEGVSASEIGAAAAGG